MKNYFKSVLPLSITIISATAMLQASASEVSEALLREYQQSSTAPFNAETGKALWTQNVDGHSCTTCHSNSVKTPGKHQRTGKIIQPMSPSINPNRLTDRKKIEKWFLRNCQWTFGRECTTQEKGNILLWLTQQ